MNNILVKTYWEVGKRIVEFEQHGKITSEYGHMVNSDGWKDSDGLILDGYKHHRVHNSHNEFARGKSHINGIENFWGLAKVRLAKFRGIHKSHFYLHLKE